MPRRLALIVMVATVPLAALLTAASRPAAVASAWRSAPIVIDGDDADWAMPASEVAKTPLFMSVANDGTHLYLRLRTSDPSGRMQVLRSGLIVSFDPTGRDKRSLGLRYPVGMPPPLPESREGGRTPPGGNAEGERRRPDAAAEPADVSTLVPNRLEVYGRDKDDARSLVLDQATGLEVRVARQQDTVVYELRLPLLSDRDHPYAVGAAPGAVIGLGLESPKWEAQGRPGPGGFPGGMGGRAPGGVGGGRPGSGMGGQGRPRGGQGPEGARFAPPKPWKVWTTVQLAREP